MSLMIQVEEKGMTREGEQHRQEDDDGGQPIDGLVHFFRGDELFAHELEGVGHGLDGAVGAHLHGTGAELHMRRNLALHPDEKQGVHRDQGDDRDQADDHPGPFTT